MVFLLQTEPIMGCKEKRKSREKQLQLITTKQTNTSSYLNLFQRLLYFVFLIIESILDIFINGNF